MDFEATTQDQRNENKYKVAGILAIISGVLVIPVCVFEIILDFNPGHNLLLLSIVFAFSSFGCFCSLYAFYQFKNFLNEHYDFHDIDKFVIPIIIITVGMQLISYLGNVIPALELPVGIIIIISAIAFAIVSLIYYVVLLRLKVSLNGMLKPYAYVSIASCICLMLIILIPIAIILAVITEFMLGFILLKPKEEMQVEFV